MTKIILLLCSFLITLVSVHSVTENVDNEASWEEAGYIHPSISQLKNIYPEEDELAYSHKLELDLLVVRESGWSRERLVRNYKKVAVVYAQCGLKFSPIRVIEVDAPNGEHIFHHGGTYRESSHFFGENTPNWPRITNIHVETIHAPYTGSSGPLFVFGPDHRLLNRQWIGLKSAWEGRRNIREESLRYLLETHELAHVLLNDGHHIIDDPSDVMDLSHVAKKLREDQCQKIYNHSLVKPI